MIIEDILSSPVVKQIRNGRHQLQNRDIMPFQDTGWFRVYGSGLEKGDNVAGCDVMDKESNEYLTIEGRDQADNCWTIALQNPGYKA